MPFFTFFSPFFSPFFFSLERTLWALDTSQTGTMTIGFYRGAIYRCNSEGTLCSEYLSGNYLDLFWVGLPSFFTLVDYLLLGRGWAVPLLGIGRISFTRGIGYPVDIYRIIKIYDNWVPTT